MEGFDPGSSFGPDVAARYDDDLRGDEAETVDFLAELAGDGAALELAIGTGRIALPLAARDVRVDGIELSEAMVARLRAKPVGNERDVVIGDMAAADAPGSDYRLVYLVFNTIHNLLTQDDLVRCFENACRHLADGGVFVVEASAPGTWLRGRQYLSSKGVRLGPISQRIAFPGELDLMARIAGLRLVDRFGGWRREPYTADSIRHVSVYGR